MEEQHKPRREAFAWQTKQELYDYFSGMYEVERKDVDEEIESVLKVFQIRRGRPINPQELWEKVGVNLEKKISKQKAPAETGLE